MQARVNSKYPLTRDCPSDFINGGKQPSSRPWAATSFFGSPGVDPATSMGLSCCADPAAQFLMISKPLDPLDDFPLGSLEMFEVKGAKSLLNLLTWFNLSASVQKSWAPMRPKVGPVRIPSRMASSGGLRSRSRKEPWRQEVISTLSLGKLVGAEWPGRSSGNGIGQRGCQLHRKFLPHYELGDCTQKCVLSLGLTWNWHSGGIRNLLRTRHSRRWKRRMYLRLWTNSFHPQSVDQPLDGSGLGGLVLLHLCINPLATMKGSCNQPRD